MRGGGRKEKRRGEGRRGGWVGQDGEQEQTVLRLPDKLMRPGIGQKHIPLSAGPTV